MQSYLAFILVLSLLVLPIAPVFAEAEGETLKLRIMETTDIHVNLVNYDYYKDASTDQYGLAMTATLIKQYREEATNSLLFDNGDLIQGNPLGDYVAKVDVLEDGEVHPVYKAMNLLNYDVGNIGNHEFNFGLEFLEKSLKGSNFPYVNANVYIDDQDNDPTNDKNYFTPYKILEKTFLDENGNEQNLKVGVIGFVPPQITQWDKANLEGKVIAKDMIETANKFIPLMKEEGADIIVAIPHSGFEDIEQSEKMENSVLYLSKVEGIDAILFGHAHKNFPSSSFEGKSGVDLEKGTINGVPSVEPGFWGNHLGVIDLTLEKVDGKWKVIDSKSEAVPIYKKEGKIALVEPDQEILDAVKEDHDNTLEYVRGPVGETTAGINSFFALVQDDPSIQIVTNAQKWYIEKAIQGTDYEGIPVLSAGAPFKAGGRGGASYYTNIPAGTIAIKNVSDLYIYPNTVHAVLLNGAEVKEWLEWSAGQFNQIDPLNVEEQSLINNEFPSYNFDVIDGVTYKVDVTEPAKYDKGGTLVNPDSNRIKDLMYEGKPINADQKFIVATNNYRASFTKLANPDGESIIIAAPDENRQAVIDYIRENKTINPSADNNWSLALINGNVNVTFETSPDAQALTENLSNIEFVSMLDSGFAKYSIDLAVKQEKTKQETIYTVEAGDVLWKIANSFGLSWEELAKYNDLQNPNLIIVGQKLLIPIK